MIEPRFCVTGSGRHGSGYIAALFKACGINCGHERYWTVGGQPIDVGLDGDSSWLAVPDLLGRQALPLVIVVVRHPLDVIASLLKSPEWGEYLAVRRTLVPDRGDPVSNAIDAWTRWNTAAIRLTSNVWKIENVGLRHVETVAHELEIPFVDGDELPSKTVNWHGEGSTITADDLPPGPLTERMWRLASHFGYGRISPVQSGW